MTRPTNLATRGLRFWVVAALGLIVQLGALAALTRVAGAGYPLATALAVEAAILHNFAWHGRWTWGDRPAGGWREHARRLLRFHAVTGVTSLVGTVALTVAVVELWSVPVLPANVLAVAAMGLANFVAMHRLVFVGRCSAGDVDVSLNRRVESRR